MTNDRQRAIKLMIFFLHLAFDTVTLFLIMWALSLGWIKGIVVLIAMKLAASNVANVRH